MEFLRVIAAQNAASSARSTLLGEAGWHRADLAEARTRDDGLKLWRCAGSHKLLPRGGEQSIISLVTSTWSCPAILFRAAFYFS